MLDQRVIGKLEGRGFHRWQKGDMDRLYVNAEDILDFEFSTYRTGNISGATLDGEKISNSRATELRAAKTYVDVATGRLYSGHHLIEAAAKAIIESVMDEIRAEEEAAEAAETDETKEEKTMFIKKTETNPFVNRALAGNGGGYSQPFTVLHFADGVRVEVEDTSCGDFGSRYWVSVYQGEAEVGRARWGSMLRKDEEFSSISSGAFGSHLKAIEDALGIHVLTAEDISRR